MSVKCSINGCPNESWAKGLCPAHLRRRRLGKPMDKPLGHNRILLHDFLGNALQSNMDECIEWPFGRDRQNYGAVQRNGKVLKAHRLVAGICFMRELKSWEVVRHTCDNPPCCNPKHLRVGTQTDNIKDMFSKGRNTSGMAKLNRQSVKDIKRRYALGERQASIAKDYGVHRSSISNVCRGKTYASYQ